jgi:FixJ family two-component response regulator
LDLQVEMRARGLTTPIVFLTGHGDIPSSVTAMKAGAVDFLTKPASKTALLAAVNQALQLDQARRAAHAAKRDVLERVRSLTPRETEVLQLVVQGLPNKLIGAGLGASEATVKVHRGRVMQKMRVLSVAELVRAAELAEIRPSAPAGSPAFPQAV